MDPAAWQQTVNVAMGGGVIKAAPPADAYRTDLATKALAADHRRHQGHRLQEGHRRGHTRRVLGYRSGRRNSRIEGAGPRGPASSCSGPRARGPALPPPAPSASPDMPHIPNRAPSRALRLESHVSPSVDPPRRPVVMAGEASSKTPMHECVDIGPPEADRDHPRGPTAYSIDRGDPRDGRPTGPAPTRHDTAEVAERVGVHSRGSAGSSSVLAMASRSSCGSRSGPPSVGRWRSR